MIWLINLGAELAYIVAYLGTLLVCSFLVGLAWLRAATNRHRRPVLPGVEPAPPVTITHPEDDPYRVACCRECGRPLTVHHEERVQ